MSVVAVREHRVRSWSAGALLLLATFLGSGECARAVEGERALTFYVAQISSESGWEDVMVNPVGSAYVNDYLVVAALSQSYRQLAQLPVQLEAEGQVAYNFGGQEYWEFNAVPLMARWRPVAWTDAFTTSLAFGLGLSYATRLPRIEVELEGESEQLLIYWVAEVTAGPNDGRWALALRLHHRSVGYGLMGEEGGMNAVGLGMRWRF